jgi:predicted nucleic acid-binding Zn ribbon protein
VPTADERPDLPSAPRDGAESIEHHAEGLELARTLARSTARSAPAKRVRRRGTERRTGPAKASGAFPDERDPQLLDATVSRLVDDHGWDVDLRVAGVFARWAELVGEDIARHTTPESFAEGTLRVRSDSTAWATELKLLAPNLVKRLNEELGHGTVTLVEVVGPHGPSWKWGPRSVRDGRGPRDTYG